jgi:hypothetical protein
VNVFTHLHIALTALTTGAICLALALWRMSGPRRLPLSILIGLISAAAVYLYRASANLVPLNQDGISGFSANDWLAPVVVFVALSVFADLVGPMNHERFAQIRGLATISAFAVNVVTI